MINIINITKIKRPPGIAQRIESFNWDAINVELDAYGAAVIGPLLSPDQYKTLINGYENEDLYRSRVVMARHGFGRGEYKYFTYPLPSVIAELREGLYPYLAEIANRWNKAMGIDVRYPAEHEAFKARCHEAGQTKPTPLILKYTAGDYNCLHQDLYGELLQDSQRRICCPMTSFTAASASLRSVMSNPTPWMNQGCPAVLRTNLASQLNQTTCPSRAMTRLRRMHWQVPGELFPQRLGSRVERFQHLRSRAMRLPTRSSRCHFRWNLFVDTCHSLLFTASPLGLFIW
jgi:hypothetical protein